MALYFRSFAGYPLLVAANRDEHFDRPSAAPALTHRKPSIIAGIDLRAGGTWLGVNEHGLAVGILNRRVNGAALPPSVARSRGLLCMDLLQCVCAEAAASFIAADDARYNPFTVVFADKQRAYVSYNNGPKIITQNLEPGLHVFSSAAELDLGSAKAERAHQRFAQFANDFLSHNQAPRQWLGQIKNILADHSLHDGSNDPADAICVHREGSGTVSSSVIFYCENDARFETFHCAGAPCQNSFDGCLTLKVR